MARRTFTLVFKDDACRLVTERGYSPAQAGRALGVAEMTKSELAREALAGAIRTRRPGDGLLHHSDRGVQYTSDDYQRLLGGHEIESSMSGVGQCWDNAVAESFFSTLKRELVNGMTYATHDEARSSLFEWIECWYNRRRLHSSLGYKSPEQFEAELN